MHNILKGISFVSHATPQGISTSQKYCVSTPVANIINMALNICLYLHCHLVSDHEAQIQIPVIPVPPS